MGWNTPITKVTTIASGESLSSAIDLEVYKLAAILMPAAWTAAGVTFEIAESNQASATWRPLFDDQGNEVTVTTAAGRAVGLDSMAGALAACRYVKIRSGTSGAPVNQTADRTLILAVKE